MSNEISNEEELNKEIHEMVTKLNNRSKGFIDKLDRVSDDFSSINDMVKTLNKNTSKITDNHNEVMSLLNEINAKTKKG